MEYLFACAALLPVAITVAVQQRTVQRLLADARRQETYYVNLLMSESPLHAAVMNRATGMHMAPPGASTAPSYSDHTAEPSLPPKPTPRWPTGL